MNTILHAPSSSWEKGPGDDTILMEAADAVLNLQLPKVPIVLHSQRPTEATNCISDGFLTQPRKTPSYRRGIRAQQATENSVSSTLGVSAESFKKPSLPKGSPPQPETPLPRPRSSPSSTLSDDVDKVIRYLDSFRVNHSTRNATVTDENMLGHQFAGERWPGRPNSMVVNTVLSDTTNNGLSFQDQAGRLKGDRTIFRDSSLPSPIAPSIFKANSINSLQLNSPPPLTYTPGDDHDVEAVTNLINSMCVDNEAKILDWTFLDKIQRMVEELLRETRKQREATDEWVKAVQEYVDRWVHEQRLLIEIERKHALERALQQHSSPTSRVAPVKTEGDVSVAGKRSLYSVIDQQARKIEELEYRFVTETASHAPIPALKTPRHVQISDPLRRDSDRKFFDTVEELESPALPHVVCKQVRPKREYSTLTNGRRIIKFRNGSEREYLSDGTLVTRYSNGDIKTERKMDKIVIYWHDAEQTKQTSMPDGVHIYEYPNQQVERHFPDGRKEVTLATGAGIVKEPQSGRNASSHTNVHHQS